MIRFGLRAKAQTTALEPIGLKKDSGSFDSAQKGRKSVSPILATDNVRPMLM